MPFMTDKQIIDTTADELRAISRKLSIYADRDIDVDMEAHKMSRRCWEIATLLDAIQRRAE
jgi:hypothetical protein